MGFHRELASGKVSLAHIVEPPILRTLVIATPAVRPLSTMTQFIVDSTRRLLKRSEEHTSELQSLMRISYAVFCLKKTKHQHEKIYKSLNHTDTHNHHKY